MEGRAVSVRILTGDCREELKRLSNESVHCCVTSPPFWGLRDYGVPNSVWGGGGQCQHEWGEQVVDRSRATPGIARSGLTANGEHQATAARFEKRSSYCRLCSAWLGALGLEPSPELYVEHLVEVFREVRRVLRSDGTLWLNLGDSYATGAGAVGEHPGGGEQGKRRVGRGRHTPENSGKAAPRIAAMGPITQPNRMPIVGLKPKDLVGIPWRVAFALQQPYYTGRIKDVQDRIWLAAMVDAEGCIHIHLVADRHGRDAVLIELNPKYAEMARRRIRGDAPLFAEVGG